MSVVYMNGDAVLSYNGRVTVAMIKIYIYITTFDPQDGGVADSVFYFIFCFPQSTPISRKNLDIGQFYKSLDYFQLYF